MAISIAFPSSRAAVRALVCLMLMTALAGVMTAADAPKVKPSAKVAFCVDTCDIGKPSFSASTVQQLTVFVSWRDMVGVHKQTVEIVTPSGAVFSTYKQTVNSKLPRVSNGWWTGEPVPVMIKGTAIQDRAMYGVWKVRVSLDDEPAAANTSFSITR